MVAPQLGAPHCSVRRLLRRTWKETRVVDSRSDNEPEGKEAAAGDGSASRGASEGIGQRFLVGSFYLAGLGWVTSAIAFAANLVLARLLGPDGFGLYALVAAVNGLIGMIGGFSIGLAVLQAADESQDLYDTGFLLTLVLSAVALAVTLVVAPFLAESQSVTAAWMLIVLGLSRFFLLSSSILVAKIERQLAYRAVAVGQLLSSNVPSLVAVACAALGAGAWSLVARDALVPMILFGVLLVPSGYRYRNRVSRARVSSIMAFARPMFLSRALEVGLERIDRLIVGAWLGDKTLGLYHQARILSETGMIATRPLNRLSFNLYSRLQDQPERLARSYAIVNFFLVRLVFAGSATLLIFPAETVRLLLGDAWVDAAPLLRILGLYASLLPVFENMKQVLYGRARVKESVRIRVVQLVLLVLGTLAGALLGSIEVVAGALLACPVIGILLADRVNRSVLGTLSRDLFLAPVLCLGMAALALGLGASELSSLGLPYWLLPFLPPLVYGLLLLTIEHRKVWRELQYLRSVFVSTSDAG